MKKLSSFLLLAIVLAFSGFSQNNYTIQIGEQTSTTSYVPTNTNYNHSYVQMIYDGQDVGLDGDITSISFHWDGYSGTYNTTRRFKIWMKEDTTSMFSSTTDWESISTFTQVLDTTITLTTAAPTTGGWITFTLSTPFHFSNTAGNNLIVAVASDTAGAGRYFSSYWYKTTTTSYRSIYYQNDNTVPNPATPPTANSRLTYVPNIMLTISSTSEYCRRLAYVSADTVMADGITISWPEIGSASSYTVEYKKSNDATWTVESTNVTDTSYTFSNWDAATYYDVRVAINCSNGISPYREEDSILTQCVPATLPFTENFDSYTSSSFVNNLVCWTRHTNSSTYPQLSTTHYSGTRSMFIYGSSSRYTMAVLPVIDVNTNPINTLRLRFFMRSSNYNYAKLIVGTVNSNGDSTSFVAFDTLQNTASSTWEQQMINFSSYTGTGERIALKFLNSTTTSYSIYVDDVTLEVIPECTEPENLACDSSSTTSATLSWTSTSTTSNDFVVAYCKANDSTWLYAGANLDADSNYELDNLDPATYYHWTVGIVCSDDTIWAFDSAYFATACEQLEVPYTENFDGLPATFIPACWDTIRSNGAYPAIYSSATYALSGNKSLRFQSSTTHYSYAIMPSFEDDLSTLRLDMYVRPSNLASSGKFEIGYMTDVADTNSFVSMLTLQSSVDWDALEYKRVVLDFDTITSSNVRIAFRHLPTSSNYYFYADSITVDAIPACAGPTGLEVVSVDNSSATVTWNYSDANTYNLYYKEASQDTWTPVNNVSMSDDTTYTINNLATQTTYQWFVTNVCASGEASSYDTLTLSTTMIPVSLPFTTDFSDASDTNFIFHNGTCTNKWYRGIPSGYTNHALYVSKNGTDTSYTISGAAGTVNVMKTFTMPATDSIVVEFDMVIGGEGNYDYLKVLLTPANVVYEAVAGTNYPTYAIYTTSTYAAKFGTNRYFVNSDSLGYLRSAAIIPQEHFVVSLANPDPNGTANFYLVWKNDGGIGNSHSPVIQNLSIRALSCPAPSITLSDTTTSSINYSISTTSQATSFEVQYKLASDTSWTSAGTVGLTTEQLTDLQSGSDYQIRVRAICDAANNDVSSWTTQAFRTNCDNLVLPYIEDFDSYSGNIHNMFCWNIISTTTTFPKCTNTYVHSGTHSLLFNKATTATNEVAVLPLIDAQTTPINSLRLSFYMRSANINHAIIIGAMSNREDTTTFVAIDTVKATTTATWQRHIIDLSSYQGTAEHLALKAYLSTTNSNLNIDDLRLELIPSCPAISERGSLHVTDATDNTATLAFTDTNENHTQWNIYYRETSNTSTWQSVSVTSPSNTIINNLTPVTQYTAFVVPICSDGQSTDTSDYCTFLTTSIPITTFPYTQTFEDSTAYTDIVISGHGRNQWHIGTATAVVDASLDSNHSMYVSNDNGVSNAYTISSNYSHSYAVMTVGFGEDAEYNLSFDYKVQGELTGTNAYDYLAVYVLNGGSQIDTNHLPADSNTSYLFRSTPAANWRHCDIVLSGVQNTTKQIAFVWVNDGGLGTQPPAAVDNITITTSSCSTPYGLVVDTTTTTTTDLHWIDAGHIGSYTVYYKEVGTADYDSIDVTDTTVSLTGLNPSTSYEVYVATNCSDEQRISSSVSFATKCVALTINDLPYVQNFEDVERYDFPVCWQKAGTYTNNSHIYPNVSTETSYAHSGEKSLQFYSSSSTKHNYVILPAMDIDIHALSISFWAKAGTSTSTNQLDIGIISNPEDTTTFELVGTIPANTSMQKYSFNFNNTTLTGNTNYIALRHRGYNTNNYWFVDDITVQLGATCSSPYNVKVVSASSSQATLSWSDSNNNTSYNVYYTNNTTNQKDSVTNVSLDANGQYTLSSLDDGTTYTVTVGIACSDGSMALSEPITLKIEQDITPVSLPYSTTFADATNDPWFLDNGTGTNKWYMGTPNGYTGTYLFVSNNGSDTIYADEHTYINAVKKFYMNNADSVNISFDINVEGEIDNAPTGKPWDYVKVFFAPEDFYCPSSNITMWNDTSYYGDSVHSNTYAAYFEYTQHYTLGHYNGTINLTMANPAPNGVAKLVILWHNDMYTNGYPSAIISNLSVNAVGGSVIVPQQPTVTTNAVTTFDNTTATLSGSVSGGNQTITARGFEYKVSSAATYSSAASTQTSSTFTAQITGLTPATQYTVRAFVTTSVGNVYGSEVNFTTLAATPEPCTPTAETINASICDGQSYTLNGQTYTTAGTYYDTLQNAAGCDSVITLNLTVNPTYNETVDTTITQGESVTLNGTTYTESGTYTATLTSVDGCDSTITLNLTVTDTATGALIDVEGGMVISLYPNPTSTNATLTIEGLSEAATIILTDQQGKEISRQTLQANAKQTTIDTYDLASGVYYVRIISGTTIKTQKLIKK